MGRQHIVLWVIQTVFGIFFISTGVVHFVVPAGLPEAFEWMYDVSDPVSGERTADPG